MKLSQVLLLLLFQICWIPSFAQRAYDGSVMIGGRGVIGVFEEDGTKNFSLVPNIQAQFNDGFSSISDTNGKLIIACNVHKIFDGNGDVMDGGNNITPAKISQADYYPKWTQGSIILPVGNDIYHVFTTTMSDENWEEYEQQISFIWDLLTYHTVDMKLNNGLGKVIKSNQVLMKDADLSYNRMTAVKHANGRDWWLVKPHVHEHLFYSFLITPYGITGPFEQKLDLPKIPNLAGLGQSSFNQQGDKYAYCWDDTHGAFVLNFDRCAGKFSPYHYYPINQDSSNIGWRYTSGATFSPDGKLLYVSTGYMVFQIDLADTNASSAQFIHGLDNDSINPFFPGYINIRAGADDKLYMSYYHNTRSTISYIDKPNLRGVACDFCPQCLTIPNQNASGMPNMPYYHLGALAGSECDSIRPPTEPELPSWETIKVYPNPSNGLLHIIYSGTVEREDVVFRLFDMLGNIILEKKSLSNMRSFQLPPTANGVYTYTISGGNEIFKRDKLVIER